jgi:acyl carrier protein phosphodiesterase
LNYLAHTYLSDLAGDDEKLFLGNFIADHVKGNHLNHFDAGIVRGIMLHRKTDEFTDKHPSFIACRERLTPRYHKYAGVITDMFYDHFLAANWSGFSDENLKVFTERHYRILLKNFLLLPGKTKRILPFMIRSNWLASYARLEFLQRSLEGMAVRTPFQSHMEKAVEDLREDYSFYKKEFYVFFPAVIAFVKGLLAGNLLVTAIE